MSTATILLTWKDGQYSASGGYAGDIRLFGITWKTGRDSKNWIMGTDLPGFTHKRWESDDRDELHVIAEKFLAAWIARVSRGVPALAAPGTTTETETPGER